MRSHKIRGSGDENGVARQQMGGQEDGETLKFMYIKYQPIVLLLPKVYQVQLWCNRQS